MGFLDSVTVVSWMPPYTRCLACTYDLEVDARETALAEAVAGRDPRELPPQVVFYWTGDLTICPRCGAPLPE